jgi:hypothetical protein
MLDQSISQFSESALGQDVDTWDETAVRKLASLVVPFGTIGASAWIVDADTRLLWARWFLESVFDPALFRDGITYAHLFARVQSAVEERTFGMTPHQRGDITKRIANVLRPLLRADAERRRAVWARETRLLLRELYPRCWVCGSSFPDWAIDKFVGNSARDVPAPLPFVDYLRPRGLVVGDLQIEVDHVNPFSLGGGDAVDNLRLACGWCNRHKAARSVIYDAPGSCRRVYHPKRGRLSVPQPFWTVRALALVGRCEHLGGCDSRSSNSELTVAPRFLGGAPNPANLMVVCSAHDPLSETRLVSAKDLGKLRG